jgi:hypothetical protein
LVACSLEARGDLSNMSVVNLRPGVARLSQSRCNFRSEEGVCMPLRQHMCTFVPVKQGN